MALISLVEPEDVGIVLAFSQVFVGRMAEFPVCRPGAKLDLGDQASAFCSLLGGRVADGWCQPSSSRHAEVPKSAVSAVKLAE
ncbi:hypothetical protein RP75_28665 [Agrobacterium arsenijevicii]|uniref:Uncharacterized protein n=1 Tax=Agrobacterium arsenijevicii TaxID=1585697 RepID=A0ABR5CYZ2_9HYPH|nr:hypothetical protein RP75_28665 [Agrobacterium arsenijevicii]